MNTGLCTEGVFYMINKPWCNGEGLTEAPMVTCDLQRDSVVSRVHFCSLDSFSLV